MEKRVNEWATEIDNAGGAFQTVIGLNECEGLIREPVRACQINFYQSRSCVRRRKKTKVEHLVERENWERLSYLGEENRKRDRCSKYRAK